ncbi:MAG TPA: hypothetical protein PLP83_10285 [Candidatus Aminicenantes bacterium]|nr:hypothetical protein [Candidatus Aminicenantes bacterium]
MAEPSGILDSWKEISDYLKKDTRTCQRYEHELGLPVHRLDGSPRARVFAYKNELDAWLARSAGEHEHRKRRLRRALMAGAAVSGAAAAVLLIWRPWAPREAPFIHPSDRPSIAILNLANRTGQKDLDQYRNVLPAMIGDDLSQSRYIYVVPPDHVLSVLTRLGLLEKESYTRENLRAVGRRAASRFVASGFYAKAGETFLVSLKIQDAESGQTIGTAEAQGKGIDSLFSSVDDLTVKVKPLLELTAVEIANDINDDLDRVTTSSI